MEEDRLHLFGEYMLDRARGSVFRGSDPVHLRPQAYDLLCCLVENRGRLVGKEQLIQKVWQGRAVADDSLVQCLRDVRQALGPDGPRLIRTVRGRGYILDAMPLDGRMPAVLTEHAEMTRVVVEEQETDDESGAPPRHILGDGRRRGIVATAVVAVVVLLAGVAYRQFGSRAAPPAVGSLAVLPFVNETGDADADYLADGLTESLINHLSRVPALSVKSRSAVFALKGRDVPPDQAAAELGVQAILSGRAIRRGDELTTFVSLVDGRNGNQLWGEQYTRPIASLSTMPGDIATDVAERLQKRLDPGSSARLAAGYTPSGDAYLLYLRGRYHQYKTTEADILKAISFYQQAVAADPRAALPHAGLADAYRVLAITGSAPSLDASPRSRAAARRALELDGMLADAHVALGWILFYFDWDYAAAERELQTAITLSPGSADAHRAYAHLLSNLGRHAEALVEAERARELDPRSLFTNAIEGQFLFYAGKLDEAERRYRKTLEIDPSYWVAHLGLGRVLILKDQLPQAIAVLRTAVELSSNTTEAVTQLGYALARSGDREGARAVLRQLTATASTRYVPAYSFAMVRNGLGESDEALLELERSVAQRELQATFIGIDTRWDSLRPHPRFVALLERLNLR